MQRGQWRELARFKWQNRRTCNSPTGSARAALACGPTNLRRRAKFPPKSPPAAPPTIARQCHRIGTRRGWPARKENYHTAAGHERAHAAPPHRQSASGDCHNNSATFSHSTLPRSAELITSDFPSTFGSLAISAANCWAWTACGSSATTWFAAAAVRRRRSKNRCRLGSNRLESKRAPSRASDLWPAEWDDLSDRTPPRPCRRKSPIAPRRFRTAVAIVSLAASPSFAHEMQRHQ